MLKKWIIRTEFLKETYLLHFHRATDQNLQETDERHDLINTMLRDSHQKVSHEKIFPWKFWNIHRKTPMLKSLFNKVTVLRACDFIKKSLQHRCFPVILQNLWGHLFRRISANGWFWMPWRLTKYCWEYL